MWGSPPDKAKKPVSDNAVYLDLQRIAVNGAIRPTRPGVIDSALAEQ